MLPNKFIIKKSKQNLCSTKISTKLAITPHTSVTTIYDLSDLIKRNISLISTFLPSDRQRNMNLLENCNGNPIGSASLPAFLKKEVFQLSVLWSPESVLNIHWISLSPSSGPFFGHHTGIDKSHVVYEAGRMIYWCAAWVSIAAWSSFLIRSSHTSKLFGNM